MRRARARLRWFRRATIPAVALTGILLILFSPVEADLSAENGPSGLYQNRNQTEPVGQEMAEEAIGAVRALWRGFYDNLPKVVVAIGILIFAWLLVRLIRPLLRKTLKRWERFSAVTAIIGIAVWLMAIGVSLSVLAGDIRAPVGSLGLIGLALSWALQIPIESFTGWLLNSFKGYYRVGDRILVGEVFGDVYRIDFLTTTVWEIGDPSRPGFVQAEQPTGRLVTFPNNEVLAGTVFNMTRDFPYVWDELAVQIANESDLQYTLALFEDLAGQLLKDHMVEPARLYSQILRREGLVDSIPEGPQVFVSMSESWTDVSIRYLVGARERRRWKSLLCARVNEELRDPRHADRIHPVYIRRQIQWIGPDGKPREFQDPRIERLDKS
jgi:small-conductance mechanosensitive channel